MKDFKQQYGCSSYEEILEIKGLNIKFVQIEPNFWEGVILINPGSWSLTPIWKQKFQAKQHMIGFWQVWYYGTNKLVFNYEFSSLKDIVNLIDFNIRLGVKY